MTPAAPLVARFRADLAALGWAEGRLGLAVSGGADSLALLLLAQAAFPERIEAATVDHGLRPESADEAAMVADLCRCLGVPHLVLTVAVQPGNLQARARAARYDALGGWLARRGLAALATGHHADDQAETLLMRLNRGSGLAGLAAIRARGVLPHGERPVLRPLLGWRRAELAQIVADAGMEPVRDPANHDPRFDRARMRAALEEADWLDSAALAQSAAHLAEANDAVAQLAAAECRDRVEWRSDCAHYRPLGPAILRRRVVQQIIEHFGGAPRGRQLAELVAMLERGVCGNLAGVLAQPEQDVWSFRPEPPRRN